MADAYLAQVEHQRDQARRELRAAEDELGPLRQRVGALIADLARAEAERDGAYRERAQLLAWLATTHPAVIAPAPDIGEDGWQILYLTAGGQQLSWHIHPRDAELFAHVEQVPADDPRAQWDGHTTAEKYERIRALPLHALRGAADAQVAAVRALAADMRTWCSPHGLANHYADQVDRVLDQAGRDAPAVITLPQQPAPLGPFGVTDPLTAADQRQDTPPLSFHDVYAALASIRTQASPATEAAAIQASLAGRWVVVSYPVCEQIAAHPDTIAELKADLDRVEQFHPTLWLRGLAPLGPFLGLPLIPDESLPRGEIHFRPHPRPADAAL